MALELWQNPFYSVEDRLLFAQVAIEELRKDNEALRKVVSDIADREPVAYMSTRNGFISKEKQESRVQHSTGKEVVMPW